MERKRRRIDFEDEDDEEDEEDEEDLISEIAIGDVGLKFSSPCKIERVTKSFSNLLKNKNIRSYLMGFEKTKQFRLLDYIG